MTRLSSKSETKRSQRRMRTTRSERLGIRPKTSSRPMDSRSTTRSRIPRSSQMTRDLSKVSSNSSVFSSKLVRLTPETPRCLIPSVTNTRRTLSCKRNTWWSKDLESKSQKTQWRKCASRWDSLTELQWHQRLLNTNTVDTGQLTKTTTTLSSREMLDSFNQRTSTETHMMDLPWRRDMTRVVMSFSEAEWDLNSRWRKDKCLTTASTISNRQSSKTKTNLGVAIKEELTMKDPMWTFRFDYKPQLFVVLK